MEKRLERHGIRTPMHSTKVEYLGTDPNSAICIGREIKDSYFNHLFSANFSITCQKPSLPIPETPTYFVFLTKSWEKQLVHLSTSFVKCQCGSGVKSAIRDDCSMD